MAIISSLAVGKSRKSAGNITYQHYYGKEVLKQKISKRGNAKATEKQISAQQMMAGLTSSLKNFTPFINLAYMPLKGKTKFASIIKLNKIFFFWKNQPFDVKNSIEYSESVGDFFNKHNYYPYMSYGVNEIFTYSNNHKEVQSFSVKPRKKYKKVELILFGNSDDENIMHISRTPFEYNENNESWNLTDFNVYNAITPSEGFVHAALWCILCDGKPITSNEYPFFLV